MMQKFNAARKVLRKKTHFIVMDRVQAELS